jgi:hypothetical protein
MHIAVVIHAMRASLPTDLSALHSSHLGVIRGHVSQLIKCETTRVMSDQHSINRDDLFCILRSLYTIDDGLSKRAKSYILIFMHNFFYCLGRIALHQNCWLKTEEITYIISYKTVFSLFQIFNRIFQNEKICASSDEVCDYPNSHVEVHSATLCQL